MCDMYAAHLNIVALPSPALLTYCKRLLSCCQNDNNDNNNTTYMSSMRFNSFLELLTSYFSPFWFNSTRCFPFRLCMRFFTVKQTKCWNHECSCDSVNEKDTSQQHHIETSMKHGTSLARKNRWINVHIYAMRVCLHFLFSTIHMMKFMRLTQ